LIFSPASVTKNNYCLTSVDDSAQKNKICQNHFLKIRKSSIQKTEKYTVSEKIMRYLQYFSNISKKHYFIS